MEARQLVHILETLCDDVDQGRPVRRWCATAGGALVLAGMAGGLGACEDDIVPPYGAPDTTWEDCANGEDDDGDGDVDCDDIDCADDPACAQAGAYGAPPVRS